MTRRILFWIIVIAAVTGTGYHVVGRYFRTDESRIRKAVTDCAGALESGRAHRIYIALQRNLASDYAHKGEIAPIDRGTAISYLARLVQRYENFEVDIRRMDVSIENGEAVADVWGIVTAAPRGAPENRQELLTAGGRNRARIELRKDNGRWRIISSRRLEGTLDDLPTE